MSFRKVSFIAWIVIVVGFSACSEKSSNKDSSIQEDSSNNQKDSGQTGSDTSAATDALNTETAPDTNIPSEDATVDTALNALGTKCENKEECASGFCVDGVCCNDACEGNCNACNLETTEGKCESRDLGTTTCGTGACAKTISICAAGIEQTCETQYGQFFGPTKYLKKADSPFSAMTFTWSHFEDFEDKKLDKPGVTASSSSLSSGFGASLIDSVDEDDGDATDGKCSTCDALWGSGKIQFTFDKNTLGNYPTHVGIVWTDGSGQISFEAFSDCGSLGKVGPFSETGSPDGDFNGKTGEDRFFGVSSPLGITHIIISNSSGGIEVDHLHYGYMK